MTQSARLGQIPLGSGFTEAAAAIEHNVQAQAHATWHAGLGAPPVTYPMMRWYNTGDDKVYLRDPDNLAWSVFGQWSGAAFVPWINGVPPGSAAILNAGTAANNVVQLDGSGRLPAVDGSQLVNLPTGIAAGTVLPLLASDGVPDPGFLALTGGTLGNATSGATHAGSGYFALFAWYWGRQTRTNCPLYDWSGAPVAAGASAAADWAANRRVRMLDGRGKGMFGADAGAGVLTDPLANTIGATIGVEKRAIAKANLPAVPLSGTTDTAAAHSHALAGDVPTRAAGAGGVSIDAPNGPAAAAPSAGPAGAHGHTLTTEPMGSGSPLSVVQPGLVCVWQQRF